MFSHHEVHGPSWHDGSDAPHVLQRLVAAASIALKQSHVPLVVGLWDPGKDFRQSCLHDRVGSQHLHRKSGETHLHLRGGGGGGGRGDQLYQRLISNLFEGSVAVVNEDPAQPPAGDHVLL